MEENLDLTRATLYYNFITAILAGSDVSVEGFSYVVGVDVDKTIGEMVQLRKDDLTAEKLARVEARLETAVLAILTHVKHYMVADDGFAKAIRELARGLAKDPVQQPPGWVMVFIKRSSNY